MNLPGLTHAEVLRKLQLEIERVGSQAAAAEMWGISEQLLSHVMSEKRNIGPKLLKALCLRRVTLVVHRYEQAKKGIRRTQTVRKLSRDGNPYAERRSLV